MNYETDKKSCEKIDLIVIGNSFGDDTVEYVYPIAKSLGIDDVCVRNMYIGGCSIETHFKNIVENLPLYDMRVYNGEKWETQSGVSLSFALKSREWKNVVFQQASGVSGIISSYARLDGLMKKVREFAPTSEYLWNMTWAYECGSTHPEFVNYEKSQTKMYESILSAVKEVIVPRDFKLIIPCGVVIQTLREKFGDRLTRDGFHLSFGLGRYAAALTLVSAVTDCDVRRCDFKPQEITWEEARLCQECVYSVTRKKDIF